MKYAIIVTSFSVIRVRWVHGFNLSFGVWGLPVFRYNKC